MVYVLILWVYLPYYAPELHFHSHWFFSPKPYSSVLVLIVFLFLLSSFLSRISLFQSRIFVPRGWGFHEDIHGSVSCISAMEDKIRLLDSSMLLLSWFRDINLDSSLIQNSNLTFSTPFFIYLVARLIPLIDIYSVVTLSPLVSNYPAAKFALVVCIYPDVKLD